MKVSRFSLTALVPVLAANLYSQYGMVFLNWNVADLYFWFWCEFMLAGIATVAFMPFLPAPKPYTRGIMALAFVFAFLFISIFASMFAGMAYMGVWKTWSRFPEFFADKKAGLLLTVGSYFLVSLFVVVQRSLLIPVGEFVAVSFTRKALVVLGLYLVFMIHGWIREWTTGGRLDLSPAYLTALGVTLITLKLFVEAGFFDRFVKHRPSNRQSAR